MHIWKIFALTLFFSADNCFSDRYAGVARSSTKCFGVNGSKGPQARSYQVFSCRALQRLHKENWKYT